MPNKLSLDDFIKKSNIKHNNKYNYSKSIYINRNTKLKITCPIHGDFDQVASDHYESGCGCPKCDPTSTLGTEKFKEKSILKHGDRYNYSKVKYGNDNYDMVEIICKKHGSFLQRPNAHLRGQGCPKCSNNTKSTTSEFIKKSNIIHKNLYDYSLTEYKTKRDKVKIICPDHGTFEQKAYVHLSGHGCPICRNSKLERHLRVKLIENNIEFEQNKRYDDCRNFLPLPFDFYLVKFNILIECDGIQHREPILHFGGMDRYLYQKKNDEIKTNYCISNSIKLIRVSNIKEINDLVNQFSFS